MVEDLPVPSNNETPFDDFLDSLNTAQKRKEEQNKLEEEKFRKELIENYDEWAYNIEILKKQFSGVWNLFGEIQDKADSWYRIPHCYSNNYFMGASGHGYNFGAGIHLLDKLPSWPGQTTTGEKYFHVSFATHTDGFKDGPNGVGDERELGRTSELDDTLIGLENCIEENVKHQLSKSAYMLSKLKRHKLKFTLFDQKYGKQTAKIDLDYLYTNNLRDVSQELFIALNQEEVSNLPDYLPESLD